MIKLKDSFYKCINSFDDFVCGEFCYCIATDGEFFYTLNEEELILKFDKKFMEEHFVEKND